MQPRWAASARGSAFAGCSFRQNHFVTLDQYEAGQRAPFGGFGLLEAVPALYARLGELSEAARPFVMTLGEQAGWPKPLQAARDHLLSDPPAS